MASRRKKKEPPIVALIIVMAAIIGFLIRVVFFIITFIYEIIVFNKSGYKDKTNVGFLKTYFNKGNYGEFVFYRRLAKIINRDNIFLNLYLDNINTEFTEVDMIAVTNNGVYVFEVKNYRGYIYGSQNDRYWTQTFNKHSRFQFYNPIRQNYAHVKAVENILEVPKSHIIPLIAFSEKSKLRKLNITKDTHVYHFKEALKLIKKYETESRNLVSDNEIEMYKERIPTYTHASDLIKKRHIINVNEHVEQLEMDRHNKVRK